MAPPPHIPSSSVTHLVSYQGFVVGIDAHAIEIKGSEQGDPNDDVVIRSFMYGDHIQNGEQDPQERRYCNYRISDVRIGDKVLVKLHGRGDVDICVSIIILGRPGGLVPPAPWEVRDGSMRPYHERLNAVQAFEERGVPLPYDQDPVLQKFQTVEQKKTEDAIKADRARIKARELWERYHIAPEPREVKR
jgi:hypothetical protein